MTAIRTKPPGKGASKASVAEDTRDRLIASAKVLFAEHGYDGVSVKELAESVGVNVSLVSYHFGGKENLYRECLEQFGKERLAVAQRVLQPPQSLDELRFRLKMFLEEMFACHLEDRAAAQMIHRECEMELPLAPDVFQNTFLKVFETMIEFFRSAQAAGLVRSELDPFMVSHLVFGGIKHVVRSDKISEKYFGLTLSNEAYRHKLVDHILQCSIYGITVESGPAQPARTPERSHP